MKPYIFFKNIVHDTLDKVVIPKGFRIIRVGELVSENNVMFWYDRDIRKFFSYSAVIHYHRNPKTLIIIKKSNLNIDTLSDEIPF